MLGIEAGGLGGGQGGVGRVGGGRPRGRVVDRGPPLLLPLPFLQQPPVPLVLRLVASRLQVCPAGDSSAAHFLEKQTLFEFALRFHIKFDNR